MPMLKRLRNNVSPATVIATIALFAALGSGYATAFSGSGSLQKAALDGVSLSFQDARSVKGFGMLQARCETTEDEIEYRFRNTTSSRGYAIYASVNYGTENFVDAINPGENSATFESGGSSETVRFYLYSTDSGDKAQADITAKNAGPTGNQCTSPTVGALVRILVLNTQQ